MSERCALNENSTQVFLFLCLWYSDYYVHILSLREKKIHRLRCLTDNQRGGTMRSFCSRPLRFLPRVVLSDSLVCGWSGIQEFVGCVAVATEQRSTPPPPRASPFALALTPLSSSQALILLASPWARRGVRVGSICLCDGHWSQALQGMEGEERRLVWSGRIADVSDLSCGTPNCAELKMRKGQSNEGPG